MKKCYSEGCYYNMPCHNPYHTPCHSPCMCPPPTYPQQNQCGCSGIDACGNINITIPVALLIFAGGYLLGQKC